VDYLNFDPQRDLEELKAEEAAASPLPGDTVLRFPDPGFEAAVREIIGKPEEDIIASDVAEITDLDVSGRGIADLTGIEYFAALKVLDCRENRLTTLDVSHNFALKKLYCSHNLIPYPSDIKGLNFKRVTFFVFAPQDKE
jgi:Leucine-rich repeat (LRR) protein